MPIILRPAVESDLDNITDIALEAWPRDESWSYRHRYHKQFPEDARRYTRLEYANFIGKDSSRVIIAEQVDESNNNPKEMMAVSIWRMPYVTPGRRTEKC